MVTEAPPVMATFLSLFSVLEWNATHCPSGEKTGALTSRFVPAIGRDSISDISRKYNWLLAT